jgi:hypothetical protein
MSPRKMSAFSILGLQHVAKFASEKIEICNDAIVLRPMDRRFGGISIGENFSHQEMPHCSPGVGICPMLIHMGLLRPVHGHRSSFLAGNTCGAPCPAATCKPPGKLIEVETLNDTNDRVESLEVII